MATHLTKSVLGCGLALTLLLSLSACSTPVQKVEVSSAPVTRPELTLPPVDVVRMRKVEWIIVTEKNWNEVVAKAKADGNPVAFFSLSGEGYADLGLNFSDIRALVQQQQAIIAAYDSYYKESSKAIDNANEQLQNSKKQEKTSIIPKLF
jgi:hypothetical protein